MTMLAMSQAGSVIGHAVTSADGTVSGKVASVQIISNRATATLNRQQIALAPASRSNSHKPGDALDLVHSAIWTVIVACGER